MTPTHAMPVASGLLLVDKPGGITSHGAVSGARRAMGTRKIGHAGTLDPMATGLLILGVERATRLLGHLALHDKEYLATIRLGSFTVTDDAEGDVTWTAPIEALERITESEIAEAMLALTGEIEQVPSSVSAIKVDGKRSYARVRAGEDVELKARSVTVSRFERTDLRRGPGSVDIDVRVECTTGTYVRALARDLGAALGVGAHLTMLRRTRIGSFSIDDASTPESLGPQCLIPIAQAARACFPSIELTEADAGHVSHGRRISLDIGQPTALFSPVGDLLALAENEGDRLRYLAVFVG
ncbi:MAG: tRNA pseudouridine(55) synthase TruB [Candidatus Nanopelagicales bacterium]